MPLLVLNKLILLGFIALCGWSQAALAQTLALPTLNTPVIDQSNTLSPSAIQQLDTQIRAIDAAGRAQMGVVLVPSTGNESVFGYAMRVAEQWQLGDADKDNGLLIVVAVQDRRLQILTGYGLEGVLPDAVVSRIIREDIRPAFRTGDYAGGLQASIKRMDSILQLDPEIARQQAAEEQEQAYRDGARGDAFDNSMGFFMLLLIIGQFLRRMLGRLIAAVLVGGSGALVAWLAGFGLMGMGLAASLLFILIMAMGSNKSRGKRKGRSGVYVGGGSLGGLSSGGFSSGGFSGGGGGFGGGGASGSW